MKLLWGCRDADRRPQKGSHPGVLRGHSEGALFSGGDVRRVLGKNARRFVDQCQFVNEVPATQRHGLNLLNLQGKAVNQLARSSARAAASVSRAREGAFFF